ncbi:hypothetical protein ElyMa_002242300 [Elysia marginata]|uniref:Uncharacterized protein n=1 Tax=Elysia marginata TaxID=1093978 RepID=A0AAV4FWT3_9GAST|nr:hypothetical protein ElyMa_002242300 [Elysia marginata]
MSRSSSDETATEYSSAGSGESAASRATTVSLPTKQSSWLETSASEKNVGENRASEQRQDEEEKCFLFAFLACLVDRISWLVAIAGRIVLVAVNIVLLAIALCFLVMGVVALRRSASIGEMPESASKDYQQIGEL